MHVLHFGATKAQTSLRRLARAISACIHELWMSIEIHVYCPTSCCVFFVFFFSSVNLFSTTL